MDKFNFKAIGTNYTILDKDTQQTDSIRVIDAQELYAAIGSYTGKDYTYINAHLAELLKGFSGFAPSPYCISWYAAPEETFELNNAIVQARREGNHIVVMEMLPEKEVDNSPIIS